MSDRRPARHRVVVSLVLAGGLLGFSGSKPGAVVATAAEPSADAPTPDPLAECEPLVKEGPERWKSYQCLYIKGRLNNRIPEVTARMDALLAEDPSDTAAISIRASCAVHAGADDMIDWMRRAQAALEDEGDLGRASYAAIELSDLLHASDEDAAARSLAQGVDLAERSGKPKVLLWARMQQAQFTYRRGGNLDEVSRALTELREQAQSSKDLSTRIQYLMLTESFYGDLDQHERVIASVEEQLRLFRKIGDEYGQARTLGRLIIHLWDDPERIDQILGVSLAQAGISMLNLARRSGNRWAELQAQLLLGEMRMGTEEERFARCSELAEQLENRYQGSRCLAARALLRLSYDVDAAFEDIDRADQMVQGMGIEYLWNGLVRMAMTWRSQPRERALAVSLAHLDALEEMFRRHRTSLTRAYVRSNYMPQYLYVADQLLRSSPAGPTHGDIDLALRIVERMRAQELLHALEIETGVEASADDPLRQAHASVSEEISRIQRTLLEEDLSPTERTAALSKLDRAEEQERAAWAAVLGSDPRIAELSRSPPPGLSQLQRALRDDEALLAYQLEGSIEFPEPGASWSTPRVAVITRGAVHMIDLAPGRDLEALIDLFGGLFESRGGHIKSPAAGLYERVMAEAVAALPPGIEHLILVPDGPLHRLPFAALRSEPHAPPLIERYRLSQAPSLAVWYRLRRSAPPDGPRGALVLADPEVVGAGPLPATERAWALSEEPGFGRLPHARAEGEALVRHVGEGSELRVGDAATEAGLEAGDLEAFSILHFASHAVLDDEHPERSAVLLAPGSPAEDGLLQTREIAQLQLRGALVVLASCRSGSGAVVGGEGPVGLSRAFFEAGARTVVASLWRLRDDDAAAIFDAFYRYLRQGLSVSEALRAAQRERREAGAPAAAWAGIVVLGDGEFVPVLGGARASTVGWWSLFGVLGLAFVFGGVAGLRSRRRARE